MIPKIIHYCWFGGNPKPRLAKKCIRSWKKYCPDYEIVEWNEDNYDYQKCDFIREAYNAKKWGFVPDYARLDIIYNHGGIYLDTDVEVLRPFDPLLDCKGFIGFENDDYLALGLGFGAEAGNEIIKALLDSYEARHFTLPDGSYDQTPSPQNDSLVLANMGVELNGTMQKKNGFVFLPTEYLNPISFETGEKTITDNTFSAHWYAGSWTSLEQRRERKKNYFNHRCGKIKLRLRIVGGRVLRSIFGDKLYEKLKGKFS